MKEPDTIRNKLRTKLKCTEEYGRILDRQLSALNEDDASSLIKTLNLMDECFARLKDADRQLEESGLVKKGDNFLKIDMDSESDSIGGLLREVQLKTEENISKIERNQQVTKSKQEQLTEELHDLSSASSVKNYFRKQSSGEFLDFSS